MFSHRARFAAVASLLSVIFAAAAAGQSLDPDAPLEIPDPTVPAIEDALDDFGRLQLSLQADAGVYDRSVPVVQAFRDRVDGLLQEHPSDLHLLAMRVQLATWLKDDDAVDEGYRQLMGTPYATDEMAAAWLSYFKRRGAHERVDSIYAKMVQNDPDDLKARVDWATHMLQNARFQEAVETLEAVELDPSEDASAVNVLAKCYFATQRFQDCLDTLDSIPGERLERDTALAGSVERLREQAVTYVDLWAKEQEIRSAEAAANDLPRVEMTTDKGTMIIELFENEAPNTVANFIRLVEDRQWYDQQRFFSVLRGNHVQFGDPITRTHEAGRPGGANPGWFIPDEHTADAARNHFAGSLGMAKRAAPNTAACVAYITVQPAPHRNGSYTVFGRVIEGLDVLGQIRTDDMLYSVKVLRKRNHDYAVEKLPGPTGD